MTADTTHRQGCPALGGYGHGVRPCACGADTPLEPCPFCGNVPRKKLGDSGNLVMLVCPPDSACSGSGLCTGFLLQDEAQAVAAWNRRAQAPAPQGPALVPLTDDRIKEVMDLVSEWGVASHLSGEAQLDAHSPEATSDEITYAEERTDAERSAWRAIESKLRAHGITGAPNGKPT